MSKHKPANHELASKVQKAIAKIVAAMFVVIILPAVVAISLIISEGKPIPPGKQAPEFALFNQHHQRIQTSDLKGHWSYVYFYAGDKWAESLYQAKFFRDHYEDFQSLQVTLIGISYDYENTHQAFASQLHIEHDLLSDPEGDVIKDYSAHTSMNQKAKNLAYLIDEAGAVRKVYLDMAPERQLQDLSRDIKALAQL